jgi:hypothetical protein
MKKRKVSWTWFGAFEALNWLTNQTGEMTFVGFAPPGTPTDAVAALRQGYAAASHDPEFIRQSVAANAIPYSFVGVERGSAILRSLAAVSGGLLDAMRKTIEAGRT